MRHLLAAYSRKGLSAIWEGAFKLTFAAVVIAAALGATFRSASKSLADAELADILALGMAVSGVLLLGAQTLALRSRIAANATLAVVTLGCVFTAYLVHTTLYYPENRVALIAVCGAALFGLFVAFRIIDEHRWGGVALSVAAMLVASWRFWPNLIAGISTPGGLVSASDPRFWAALIVSCGGGLIVLFLLSRIVDESHWRGTALVTVLSIGIATIIWTNLESEGRLESVNWEKHPKIRAVKFKETPNVYFVGFDGMVPEIIMRKHIGVETTEFHKLFGREARRFRNLFANSVRTAYSLHTLMALDQDIFLNERSGTGFDLSPLIWIMREGHYGSYFSGRDLSPLIWIMRENGYETTSIYNSYFFGQSQGPYIDNYVVNTKEGICALLHEDIRRWAFWGYCRIVEGEWLRGAETPKGDFLVRELTSLDGGGPQFVIAHLYMPGHAPDMFNYDNMADREEFADRYRRESDKAAIYLEEIIEHLRSSDPNAILFVFGDHGMWLSRGADLEENPAFFLQDRFGILGGVYPRDRCAGYFDEAESKGYMTILDAVHAILTCLSGGQSALVGTRHDRFSGSGVPREHEYRYEEFLYE